MTKNKILGKISDSIVLESIKVNDQTHVNFVRQRVVGDAEARRSMPTPTHSTASVSGWEVNDDNQQMIVIA